MIKRLLITCSVIPVLIIFSGFNSNNTKARPKAKHTTKLSPRISQFLVSNADPETDFSFANEALPVNDADVNRKLQRSLKKHNYRYVQTNILQSKAAELFPILEPILRAYGIPEDFKYIPLVESGLCEGTSAKGAKGLWQFMPGTARTYGLKVGHGIDERASVRKSTIAACKYIKELYVEFNSWTLAAAAYNNGEIKMEHAINKQNEDNYFRMHLNHETGWYVYNLIAMKAIINHPGKYGYKDFVYLKPSELLAIK